MEFTQTTKAAKKAAAKRKKQKAKKLETKPLTKKMTPAFGRFLKKSKTLNSMIPLQPFVKADWQTEEMAQRSSYFQYITLGCYEESELTEKLRIAISEDSRIELDGHLISTNSDRYKLYITKGCTCVRCGLKATFWALQDNSGKHTNQQLHLNLYGVNNGRVIMMTKDHILPKFRGGADHIDNYQPLCETCNKAKGHMLESELLEGVEIC